MKAICKYVSINRTAIEQPVTTRNPQVRELTSLRERVRIAEGEASSLKDTVAALRSSGTPTVPPNDPHSGPEATRALRQKLLELQEANQQLQSQVAA